MDLNYNPFSLKGKTILVTGASSGIGRATAVECSKLGAKLVLSGRNIERLNETMGLLSGEGHTMISGDLTIQEDLERIVTETGRVNGLVLCAGKGMTSPFPFSTKEKFSEIFEVNYFSPVELLRLMVKKKKLEKDSSVVMVSSIGGNGSYSLGNGIYGASKSALSATMKFCARELAPKKIRVNAVNPGMINTKLISGGAISEEQHQIDMQKYPLKRYGEPEEVAWAIIYLLSDASAWVTGSSMVIDGGILLT